MSTTDELVQDKVFGAADEVKDLAFSDQTVGLLDREGNVLAAKQIELDLPKMIADLRYTPDLLVAGIEHYIKSHDSSPMAIVLALDVTNWEWNVFEGTCNPKAHTFKVIRPITTFKANSGDPKRPPTVALNFVAAAALARGVSVWIP